MEIIDLFIDLFIYLVLYLFVHIDICINSYKYKYVCAYSFI